MPSCTPAESSSPSTACQPTHSRTLLPACSPPRILAEENLEEVKQLLKKNELRRGSVLGRASALFDSRKGMPPQMGADEGQSAQRAQRAPAGAACPREQSSTEPSWEQTRCQTRRQTLASTASVRVRFDNGMLSTGRRAPSAAEPADVADEVSMESASGGEHTPMSDER